MVRHGSYQAPLAVVVSAVLADVLTGCVRPSAWDTRPRSPGLALYEANCIACHRRFPPSAYSPVRWRSAIEAHKKRLRLSAKAAELILGHVTGEDARTAGR